MTVRKTLVFGLGRIQMRRFLSREFLAVFVPAALISIAAFWFATRYVKPAPPDTFVMSTSSKGSPYYDIGLRFKSEVEKQGVKLEVRESNGSFDNLKSLANAADDVQAGIVQGGLANTLDAPHLVSLGRLLTEPVWIFYRDANATGLDHITQLKGKRILTGPKGSGTEALSLRLLEANGVTPENSTLVSRELPEYVETFETGGADAGFLVLGPQAKTVQRLLRQSGTRLMNMAQADALIQRFPFLNAITMRQGVVDFAANIPPSDTTLVATRAALLAREGLHPALMTVLAQAVLTAQSQPALTSSGEAKLFALGTDALQEDPEFPLADEARRMYKAGPTFFQRRFPFWIATLFDRAVILIVPLIGVILPLIRIVPFLYNWRMRRRILYWYRELKTLENDLPKAAPPDLIAKKRSELERIEEGVQKISVPIQFAADLYNLRDHVEFVRRRISQLSGSESKEHAEPVLAG